MDGKFFLKEVEKRLAVLGIKTININEYEFLFPYKEEDADKTHRDVLGVLVFQGKKYYSMIEDPQIQPVIDFLEKSGFEVELV